LTKEKFLETTNGTSVGAAMEDGNWLEQRHLFEVNMDGRAGRDDALEDTSDQAGLEGGAQVGHTTGNSDIVRRVIEDEDEDYPRGTSVSIEKAGTGEMEPTVSGE